MRSHHPVSLQQAADSKGTSSCGATLAATHCCSLPHDWVSVVLPPLIRRVAIGHRGLLTAFNGSVNTRPPEGLLPCEEGKVPAWGSPLSTADCGGSCLQAAMLAVSKKLSTTSTGALNL